MPDRVVALQLLSSYWLAVILPPLPGILCFSAIYNERFPTSSGLSPYFHHQGRKFGGYKILPKPCKDTSSPEKEVGICMFNYECTQRAGTVVGSCMDGFLYGTCCKLPPGVSLSMVHVPDTTPSKPISSFASDRSTTILKPHIEHSPVETFLLYKNGTVVQNVNSPDDFLLFNKQQTPLVSQTSPLPETNDYRLPSSFPQMWSSNNMDIHHIPNNISPSQIFDTAMLHNTKPANGEQDRFSTAYPSKPYTISSSREPFSPNFSSSKYSVVATKISPFTTTRSNEYLSQSSKFAYTTTPFSTTSPTVIITNKNDVYDDEENLIRVPTLTVDNNHKYGSNNSINHILWLLNDTKSDIEDEEISTKATQSFYTWLSVQNNPEKASSAYYSTKPIHSGYHESKPSTPLPSTTLHHIPGPSFHVTPEVKITPKPQPNTAESAPTVIVLTSAHDSTSTTTKKPVHSYSTTASYNVSYHFPQVGSSSIKPNIKPAYSTTEPDKPNYNSILITAKPSQGSYASIRPQTTGFITKPVFNDLHGKPSTNILHTAFPVTSSPLPVKQVKPAITSTVQSYTKLKPVTEGLLTSSSPSFIQTTVVTTAKPIWPGNSNPDSNIRPSYSVSPIPSFTNSVPTMSTSSYVTVRPQTIPTYTIYEDNPTFSVYPGTNIFLNTTESIFDFPPVRDPNVTMTNTQQEKPIITSTTTFGDEDTDLEVTPQFVVDKTLEDKMHVFVEKIVQSLQGNFEDLEKVLINGESTNNVTISNSPTKKPPSVTKRPTKKPSSVKPNTRPQKPAISTLPVLSTVTTKKPTKKPTLATPVVLFQPSTSTEATITLPNKKPIKVTASTTISISPSTPTEIVSAPEDDEDILVTTVKQGIEDHIDYKRECGIRPLARKNGRIVGGKGSTFAEWPWQVLVREATWLGLFTKNKCGGVLITNKYVITAAHCQPGFLANLVAVFGEYDISGEVESKRSVSKNVRRVIVHRQYDAATFENDIALLELESPIQFDSHIVPICMPEDDEDFTGRMATVTGWGRLKYGGGVPSILQEVQVPVIENRVCQEMFQTAGHSKVILSSFLCAGYANGQRDSCEGDSGGPLMVERGDGHWTLVATVSHGIKCAAPYLPGVYMRTTYYKPWLQTITGV
ncbi:hypothetical protein PGB90_008832 [Kerria lacca]